MLCHSCCLVECYVVEDMASDIPNLVFDGQVRKDHVSTIFRWSPQVSNWGSCWIQMLLRMPHLCTLLVGGLCLELWNWFFLEAYIRNSLGDILVWVWVLSILFTVFLGFCSYNAENDCKCGPNCACADCQCHKWLLAMDISCVVWAWQSWLCALGQIVQLFWKCVYCHWACGSRGRCVQ
jgi:hypothetical protein